MSETKSVNPQCQIVGFKWKRDVPTEDMTWADLSAADPYDLSSHVMSCNFDKSLGSPSGTFAFTLAADRDWLRLITPGTWVLIYLSQDGDLAIPQNGSNKVDVEKLRQQRKKLRCLGYVERISAKGEVSDNGVSQSHVEIAGRDFGVVYEDCSIFFNFLYQEQTIIQTATDQLKVDPSATVDSLLRVVHDLFFAPHRFPQLRRTDSKNSDRRTIATVGMQWLLPRSMLNALGLTVEPGASGSFWGHIEGITNFKKTRASYPCDNPLGLLEGQAWSKLRALSLEPLHELYTELSDDGVPQLNFRPIPWGLDPSGYPDLASTVTPYHLLDYVPIEPIDVLSYDVGPDAHNRFNFHYLRVETRNLDANASIAEYQFPSPAGRTFPNADRGSIARYGFRPMAPSVNSFVQQGLLTDPSIDKRALLQFSEYLRDLWGPAIHFHSGQVAIMGNNDIRLGKAVLFSDDCVGIGGMFAYVEGVQDSYVVEESGAGSWTQTLRLTRGVDYSTLLDFQAGIRGKRPFQRDTEIHSNGEFTEVN